MIGVERVAQGIVERGDIDGFEMPARENGFGNAPVIRSRTDIENAIRGVLRQ